MEKEQTLEYQYTKYELIPPIYSSPKLVEQFPKEIYLYENVPIQYHTKSETVKMCLNPYYRHPKGCPNFHIKKGCPPEVLNISQQYDTEHLNMILLKFPFEQYISAKSQIHPQWPLRQLANPRHWQGHLRSTLYRYWDTIKDEYPSFTLITGPEAMGINVGSTLENMNIPLGWFEKNEKDEIVSVPEYICHICMFGEEVYN